MTTAPVAHRPRRVFPYVALIPAFVLVLALMVVPIAQTVYHSFTDWDGQQAQWIGLKNYHLLLTTPVMRTVFANSLILLVSVPLIIFASLVAAVLVYEQVRGWRTFRFLFFIPSVLSPTIIGVMFATFFLPHGIADRLLAPFGLTNFAWLSQPWTARAVIILALVWSSFGFGMVVILAAMAGIDPSLYDAAAIDGASWWRRLTMITIPLITGALQFLGVINIIYTFTSLFAFVVTITSGGPGFSTTTIDYYVYLTTFGNGAFGYGSALVVLLFFIVLTLTIAQIKLMPKREVQG